MYPIIEHPDAEFIAMSPDDRRVARRWDEYVKFHEEVKQIQSMLERQKDLDKKEY